MNPLAIIAIAVIIALAIILLALILIGGDKQSDEQEKVSDSPTQMTDKEREAYEKEKEREWKDPNEHAKYVCQGGQAQCKYCSTPISDLKVTSTTIMLQDKPWATIKDNDGLVNFNFTGQCLHPSQQKPLSPPPLCKSVISLGKWKDFSDTKIDGMNALVVKSAIPCMISGEDLTIIDSGQTATLEKIEPTNKATPKVTKLYWMDQKEREIIETLEPEQRAVLFVETEEFEPNNPITIPLEDSETGEIHELKGILNGLGKTKIPWPTSSTENNLVNNSFLTDNKHTSQAKRQITKAYWTYGKEFTPLNKKSRFYVDMNLHIETKGYDKGSKLFIELKSSNSIPLTDNASVIKLSGIVDENGFVLIKNALKDYTLNLIKF